MPQRHGAIRLAAMAIVAALAAACAVSPPPQPKPPPPLAGGACLADLAAKGAQFIAITMRPDGDCAVEAPVRARILGLKLANPATMSCGLAERLWQFDREVVQPVALRILGVAVESIRHFGAYACRIEASSRHDRLSQHAYGRAIDIAGFIFADGSHSDVESDWRRNDKHAKFLHEIARAACGYFSVVLTPDTNTLHYNHLHLDIGPDRLCGPS